jgi:hypothetical protein
MTLLRDWKRLLAVLVTGVVGLIVLLDAVGMPLLSALAFQLVSWAATLTALALLLGLSSVAGAHIRRVMHRETDWPYSIVLVLGMISVVLVGLFGGGDVTQQQGLIEAPLRIFFRTVYEPLASSLLALLAFFSLSAALRALSQRRAEAWVVVGVALVAALPFVGSTMQWVNDYVVLAGARGLLIGVALGTLVASMRVLLGFDHPFLDR